MTTLDLLKENWKAGLRMPYPADAATLASLKDLTPIGIINGVAVMQSAGLWEQGELLYLTARRTGGIVWLLLQTRGEL